MTEPALPQDDDAVAPPPPAPSAGTLLAQSREAAGLTIDDVALQLKLAPRQVVAIERDDFASLPGRTFVRGFVRNYARFLKLDVATVLAALPGDGAVPSTTSERTLASSASRSIGEMPRESRARPGIARWAIPLVLIAIVGVAVFYEFARPPVPVKGSAIRTEPATAIVPSPAPDTAPAEPAPGARTPESGANTPQTSDLPNPLAGASPAQTSPASEGAAPSAQDGAANAAAPAGATRNQLALTFRGTSWIEVRDRTGSVILSITGAQGATRELPVAAPGEVIIGNAAVVDATWRGRPIDVAAYSKQNVARVRLD